jgi:hypothetical protein
MGFVHFRLLLLPAKKVEYYLKRQAILMLTVFAPLFKNDGAAEGDKTGCSNNG